MALRRFDLTLLNTHLALNPVSFGPDGNLRYKDKDEKINVLDLWTVVNGTAMAVRNNNPNSAILLFNEYIRAHVDSEDPQIKRNCKEAWFKIAMIYSKGSDYFRAIAVLEKVAQVNQDLVTQVESCCFRYFQYLALYDRSKKTKKEWLTKAMDCQKTAKALSLSETEKAMKMYAMFKKEALLEQKNGATQPSTPVNDEKKSDRIKNEIEAIAVSEFMNKLSLSLEQNNILLKMGEQVFILKNKLSDTEEKAKFSMALKTVEQTAATLRRSIPSLNFSELQMQLNILKEKGLSEKNQKRIYTQMAKLEEAEKIRDECIKEVEIIAKEIKATERVWFHHFKQINKAKQSVDTAVKKIKKLLLETNEILTKANDLEDKSQALSQPINSPTANKNKRLLSGLKIEIETINQSIQGKLSKVKEILQSASFEKKKADDVPGFPTKRLAIEQGIEELQAASLAMDKAQAQVEAISKKIESHQKRVEDKISAEERRLQSSIERISTQLKASQTVHPKPLHPTPPPPPPKAPRPALEVPEAPPEPKATLSQKLAQSGVKESDLSYFLGMQETLETEIVLTGPFATYLALATSKADYSLKDLANFKVEQIHCMMSVPDPATTQACLEKNHFSVGKRAEMVDHPGTVQYINFINTYPGSLPIKMTVANQGKITIGDKKIDIYNGNQLIVPFLSCQAILVRTLPTSPEKRAAYDFFPNGDYFIGVKKNHAFLMQEQSGELLIAPFSKDHIKRYAFIEKCREISKDFMTTVEAKKGAKVSPYLTYGTMLEGLINEIWPAFKGSQNELHRYYLEMITLVKEYTKFGHSNARPYLEAFFACLIAHSWPELENTNSPAKTSELAKTAVAKLSRYYQKHSPSTWKSATLIRQFNFIAVYSQNKFKNAHTFEEGLNRIAQEEKNNGETEQRFVR